MYLARGCLACCCPSDPQRGLATQTSGSEDDAISDAENAVSPTMEEQCLVVSGDVIANGSAGVVVVHGRWNGRAVAVKRLQTADTKAAARAEKEVQLMRGLPAHTHVLPLLHAVRGRGVYDLVLPLASKSLFDVVVESGPLVPTRARCVLAQVARAIAHLHGFGVVHRDVKLENLLMSSDTDHVWLADFGLAHCFPDSESAAAGRLCGCTGSQSYAAPEVFYSGQRAYDAYKVDVWAMGVVLYALLFGHFPSVGRALRRSGDGTCVGVAARHELSSTGARLPASLGT